MKATVVNLFTFTGMVLSKLRNQDSCILSPVRNVQPLWKIELPWDSRFQSLTDIRNHTLERTGGCDLNRYLYTNFHSNIIHNSQRWNSDILPPLNGKIKYDMKFWYYITQMNLEDNMLSERSQTQRYRWWNVFGHGVFGRWLRSPMDFVPT